MPRRRLSSDGFKLFNMAYSQPPTKEGIRRFLSCLFRTEYDDRLEEMTDSCHRASKQLYAYSTDPIKKDYINKFIDNSIFNVIYAILCKDGQFATNFQIQQNYRYFMDVISEARKKGDHNTAIMLRAALDHHALKQKKIKMRRTIDRRSVNKKYVESMKMERDRGIAADKPNNELELTHRVRVEVNV
eukprot:g14317.t1